MARKLIKSLQCIKFTLGLALRFFISYFREMFFILRARAKFLYEKDPDSESQSLLVRKYAHVLERIVFEPSAHTKEQAKDIARRLELALKESGLKISSDQKRWASRVWDEYKQKKGTSTYCPMLNNCVPRQSNSVSADQLMALLRERRTRRVFQDIPLTEKQKQDISEAIQQTPSACNRQTLDVIFVEEPRLKAFVAATIPGGHQFFDKAPCILVLVSDIRDYRFPEDRTIAFAEAGAAIQNIYLLCETAGLGCCWGSYTSFGNVDKEREVRRVLSIPNSRLIVGAVAIGKSDQFVCDIPREAPLARAGTNGFRKGAMPR